MQKESGRNDFVFSAEERTVYGKNQLVDVICQLRFPEILTIGANLPVEFQEAIRDIFPQYSARKEHPAPRITGNPGAMAVENPPATVNYQFVSADGVWRVNLTSKFISLACTRYTCWEEFAKMLDKPLASFIRIYKPAYFERIGLRYVNAFSRKALSLEGEPFRNLFHERYLGILSDDAVEESAAVRSTVDADIAIRGGCRGKLHAGPGMVKRGNANDPEVKFIFDQDLYMPGKIAVNLSTAALQTLHTQAFSIFRGAITELLHNAMEP